MSAPANGLRRLLSTAGLRSALHDGLSALQCSENAVVIWTRHRQDPDLTPHIRGWFRGHGFEEEHFDAPDHAIYSVGVHRFVGVPKPLDAEQHLFTPSSGSRAAATR